ncbi:UNVERIFIED_CONTAM: putative pentatricopeptide repeat-containing protein [Sesamum indicum]
MREADVSANSFTFTFLLSCFESFRKFECGEMVHANVLKIWFGPSMFVMNIFLDFYAKCGENLDVVRKLFEEIPERDVVWWDTMIRTYMSGGEINSAIRLFESMPERNLATWNSVVSGLRMPERNSVLWNAMISGYIKLGDLKSTKAISGEMPRRSVVSWTMMVSGYAMRDANKKCCLMDAMIAGSVNSHMFDEALSVFHHMLVDGKCKPDHTTLISVLSACTHLNSLEHGKWIESYIMKNQFELSIPLGNALIDMFAKCGDLQNAEIIFKKMLTRCIITWTSMLAANGSAQKP